MEQEYPTIVPGERRPVVKTMALKDIAEDKALEVVEGCLHQLLEQVAVNHDVTSRGAFNTFNADRFLTDLEDLEKYIKKQFKED